MRSPRTSLLLLLTTLLPTLPACSSTPSEAADAGATTPDGGNTNALVAECQTLAATFVQHCHDEYSGDALAPDTQRMCIWTTYGRICETGNAQILLDSMRCFNGNPSCWTFSDSNSAASCLASVHASEDTPATRAFLAQLCDHCGGSACDGGAAQGQAELIPYVSSQELSAISSCLGTQCSVSSCPAAPDYAGIFGCP
jgi:hypothetical protein